MWFAPVKEMAMQGKVAFALGAALGYVVGTRAGRPKYDRLKKQATDLWEDPRVQRTVSDAETLAQETLAPAGPARGEAGKKVTEAVGDVMHKHVATDSPSPSNAASAAAEDDGKTGPAHG
jgi:hypothetical protein